MAVRINADRMREERRAAEKKPPLRNCVNFVSPANTKSKIVATRGNVTAGSRGGANRRRAGRNVHRDTRDAEVPTQRRPVIVSRRAYDREGQPAGRATARGFTGARRRGERFLGRVGHAGTFAEGARGPATVSAAPSGRGDVLFDTGHVPRELPWPTGPNVRGQMAAHGEDSREFLRICDVFPWNPWGSATIFGFLSLRRTARSSTTTSDQLSDRRTDRLS
ncbi:hypothetical protein DBV15_06065 [Temnothorax longispinosus]|uniref:Uncharacterized protein n=1 Tax=Temnothorax longispinosus TaxID=300112 RepID=A0A4S2L053_9HYME|nr:hypothetical protein DBV15_06065 [Temnothorax longispinosus]